MSLSVQTVNSELQAAIHGTTTNKIQNLSGLHNRTARQLLLEVDPIETIRKTLTTTPIYYQIWDYACPADLKGNRIIDISPQISRLPSQIILQTYNQPFDIQKNLNQVGSDFTIQFNNAIKTIRINDTSTPQGILLDSLTAIGNWSATSTASNLRVNNVNFATENSSLSFDLAAGANPSTGYISETSVPSYDLTDHLNQSSLFLYIYFPTGTDITSVEIRWGSDSSNYYSRSLTQTNEGNSFATGWNLVRADWLGATVTGSPVVTAINYFYIGVTYNGTAQTGICVDNLISNLGLYRTIEYYSKYLFRNSTTGTFQETTTSTSDLINLDTDSYNLYFNLLAFLAVQQIQGVDAQYDDNFFGQQYLESKKRYTGLEKSQVQKPGSSYYSPVKGGFMKYIGRGRFIN